jgi:cobalt-zinc-cadmium efflux system protein
MSETYETESKNLCEHHDGEDGHEHGAQAHRPHREESKGRLCIVLGLTSSLMVAELVAGYMTHSLALMADAGHMLSDVASQALALIAIWFAAKAPTQGKSYGYYRTEILASLINSVILVGIAILIISEAWHRLAAPPPVNSVPMLLVAGLGLVVNLVSMRLLHSLADHSLNIKAAYLELLGDLAASAGVLIAAAIMTFTHAYIVDPLISILIGIVILPRTWLLLSECTNILMEGTPGHIDMDRLRVELLRVEGVVDVHDIHVWTITSGLDAMSGHVCVDRQHSSEAVLGAVTRIAQQDFGIQHTTIQIEQVDRDGHA